MDKNLYRYFRIESRELLDEMGRAVQALGEGQDTVATVARLLRLAHTLKGASRVVGLSHIAEHAHAMEELLIPVRDAAKPVGPDLLSGLLVHVDGIEAKLLDLASETASSKAAEPAPAPVPSAPSTATPLLDTPHSAPRSLAGAPAALPAEPGATTAVAGPAFAAPAAAPAPRASLEDGLRGQQVESDGVDAVLAGVTESHGFTAVLRRQTLAAVRARELVDLLLNQLSLKGGRGDVPPGMVARLNLAEDMARALRASLASLDAGLSQTTANLARQLKQTKEAAEQLRLSAAQGMLAVLERVARDAGRVQGKEVIFTHSGGDVRLDTALLATVQPALVQVVRNAVAHGIETPAAREAAGKPRQGRVEISITHSGRHVLMRCTDDGAGLDMPAIVKAAQAKGLLPATASADKATVLSLLLHGGLSTAQQVTEISGRGVGMNVVGEVLEHWQGEASLETHPGEGTSLTLKFPMKMASLAVLGVRSGDVHAFVPLEAVVCTRRQDHQDVVASAKGLAVVHEDQAVPFLPLSIALGVSTTEPATWTVVILQATNGLMALGVDGLTGAAAAVLRPLPQFAPGSKVIAGVSLDVEGVPQLVLEPRGLVESAQGWGPVRMASGETQSAPLLVIDDSLTTRMLEQSILESAGYTVDTANSAEEGLQKARERAYALFLVDVDMPGMDGFTFVQTVRADPDLRHTPAILVTSRASRQDRDKGKAVGANDYIAKGDFDQIAFLDCVRRLALPT